MKVIRKDNSKNVPCNTVFNFLLGIDGKFPLIKHVVNKNKKPPIILVDSSTVEDRLEEDIPVESSDNTGQVSKNDTESKTESNKDRPVSKKQEQSQHHEPSGRGARRRDGSKESVRRQKMQERRRLREQLSGDEEAGAEADSQLTKIEKVNFVMNPEGCFINGKLFDPQNPPDGVAIIVDQKRASSK